MPLRLLFQWDVVRPDARSKVCHSGRWSTGGWFNFTVMRIGYTIGCPTSPTHTGSESLTAFRIFTLSLALVLILVVSHSHGEETVIVNKAFNGKEIKVRPGVTIQVELEQHGAAGYTWEIQELDKEHFKILSVKVADRPDASDIVGAPLMKRWRIEAIKAGKAQLKLLHYRPWEGEKQAVDTFVLNVRILGTK